MHTIFPPEQMEKIVQMQQTMRTRHSMMVVGATGAGKSVAINALMKAQNYLGIATKCTFVNPKVDRLDSGASV